MICRAAISCACGEAWAPAFVGQGRQGVDHRLAALELTEVTLHAPHRDQCLAIDAVALLDALQDVGVLADQRLAFAHTQWRQGAVEVFPHRAGKFRLAAVGADHAGVQADIGEGAVEQVGADTGGQRILAETRLPFGEGLGRLDVEVLTGRHHGRDHRRGCRDGKGLKRLGVGGGRFFRAGDKQNEAGGSYQLAQVPTTGNTKGHARVQGIRIRC